MTDGAPEVAGRNGVVIRSRERDADSDAAFRTYEVYQRERIGESTPLIKPQQLISPAYREDPWPLLEILRENYPCYRDWLGNRYWLTRYDDVTSVFADDANFETRPKAWFLGLPGFGRNLNDALPVLEAEADAHDDNVEMLAERLADSLAAAGAPDLARDFTIRLPLMILCRLAGVDDAEADDFCSAYWRLQRGVSWQPDLRREGHAAIKALLAWVENKLPDAPDGTLLAACREACPDVTAADVVRTLLERDHETLQGALSNLWYLLLTHPAERTKLTGERRLVKLAYLEALRHSPPVLSAARYTRHEVERFGRLLPEGALVVCSAAAANRDPRIFNQPDRFDVGRTDLTQREPRGQYRADGLASGVSLGTGKPSRYPALPEHRPRSKYALLRDTAVTASEVLLARIPDIALAPGAEPKLTSLGIGEMHTCWELPVTTGN